MNVRRGEGATASVLRLGLVGAGAWGRNYIRTLSRFEDARLAAVASRNPGTSSLVGAECPVHAEWQRLLEESLDGVIVASPPSTHLAITQRFIERGVPALVEKPLCLDVVSAQRFRDAVVSHRGLVMVDHLHQFSVAFQLLKRLSPSLGRITRIVSAGGRHGPFRTDTSALWDWGPHDVSMVLDIMGAEPLRVKGRRVSRSVAENGTVAENFEIGLEFREGIRAEITVGNALSPVRRIEVDHERGTLIYDDRAEHKLTFRGLGATTDARILAEIAAGEPFRPPLDCVLESFCDAIRARTPDPRHLDLAVSVVRVLEQVDRSLH